MASILVYATSGDLATWTGAAAPDNATTLLRTASLLVRKATRAAIYNVDSTGAPTDTDVIDAFRDATCAQAAAMDANDVDPLAGQAGASQEVASTSIGSASVSFANGSADTSAADLLSDLCSEAAMILGEAGLLNNEPLTGRTGP